MNSYLITITYKSGFVKIIRKCDDLPESQRLMEIAQFTRCDPDIRSFNVYGMVDSVMNSDPLIDSLFGGEYDGK